MIMIVKKIQMKIDDTLNNELKNKCENNKRITYVVRN